MVDILDTEAYKTKSNSGGVRLKIINPDCGYMETRLLPDEARALARHLMIRADQAERLTDK